jgi:hypothetical protein
MTSLWKRLETMFVAATFAEAGEYEMVREFLREEERSRKMDRISPNLKPRKELRAPRIRR